MRDSLTYSIAAIAVETGIPPAALLDCEPGLLEAMIDILRRRASESQ